MKRILAMILCLSMLIPTVAYAAPATSTGSALDAATNTVYVRYGSTNVSEVWQAALGLVAPGGYTNAEGSPTKFTQDADFTVDGTTYHFKLVRPTYSATAPAAIDADDSRNSSESNLRKYIEENTVVTQTNATYNSALGTAPTYQAVVGSFTYVKEGANYNIPITVNDQELSIEFTVNAVEAPPAPVDPGDEEDDPQEPKTVYVKYGATNRAEVWKQFLAIVAPNGYSSTDPSPREYKTDTDITVDGITHHIVIVSPTYQCGTLPDMYADDAANASESTLTKFIKENLEIKQTNEDYEKALGNGISNSIVVGNYKWVATGGRYEVPITYGDLSFKVDMIVHEITSGKPSVIIDEDMKFTCDPETVEYSINDGESWRSCKSGGGVLTDWYNKTVLFRVPASGSKLPSDSISVYCKEAQTQPSVKPIVDSTSYSVTITNASSYKNCEFSIDGIHYGGTSEWTGLQNNTTYTVYVRAKATSTQFHSTPISVQVATTEGVLSSIGYNTVSTANTIYIQASGTIAYRISGLTYYASYSDKDLAELRRDIKAYSRKTTVSTTLDVYMQIEDSDYRSFYKIDYSMPSDLGLLQLRLHTPWLSVIRDAKTTNVVVEEGLAAGAATSVRNWAKNYNIVYRVYANKTTNGGESTIIFPWTWADRADFDGLRIAYISENGTTTRSLPYSVVDEGLMFTMPNNGYFAIQNLYHEYVVIPFTDSQTHWAYSYIQHAWSTGLVVGTSPTTFAPDETLTRAQMVQLLARMRGFDQTKLYSVNMPYTDCDESDWFYSALSFCYAAGAIKPSGSDFQPGSAITRADAVTMMEKMFPYDGTLWTPFWCEDRNQIPVYALHAVDAFYTENIVSGTSSTTFSPTSTLTRAEMVTILYRLQTASYWQGVKYTHTSKLPSNKVNDRSDTYVDDKALLMTTTQKNNAKNALKSFYNSTGVRPLFVTTKSLGNQSISGYAQDIYSKKYSDTGHAVFVLYTPRTGTYGFGYYVGSAARTILGTSELALIETYFNRYYDNYLYDLDDVIDYTFRYAATDIMSLTYYSTNWRMPVAIRDIDPNNLTATTRPGTTITEPSNPGTTTTQPTNPGTTTTNPGTTTTKPGTTTPTNPGTTTPSNPGTTTPSNPGTTTPSNPGTSTTSVDLPSQVSMTASTQVWWSSFTYRPSTSYRAHAQNWSIPDTFSLTSSVGSWARATGNVGSFNITLCKSGILQASAVQFEGVGNVRTASDINGGLNTTCQIEISTQDNNRLLQGDDVILVDSSTGSYIRLKNGTLSGEVFNTPPYDLITLSLNRFNESLGGNTTSDPNNGVTSNAKAYTTAFTFKDGILSTHAKNHTTPSNQKYLPVSGSSWVSCSFAYGGVDHVTLMYSTAAGGYDALEFSSSYTGGFPTSSLMAYFGLYLSNSDIVKLSTATGEYTAVDAITGSYITINKDNISGRLNFNPPASAVKASLDKFGLG